MNNPARRDFIKASAAFGAAGLFGGCMKMANDPSPLAGPADTILLNGRIATQDERRSMVSALAIKDGRIITQGDLDGVEHVIALNVSDGKTIWAVQPAPVKEQ